MPCFHSLVIIGMITLENPVVPTVVTLVRMLKEGIQQGVLAR